MQSHPEVRITWQKRSLKEFGYFPIEKLLENFDFLIIDHPFVGFGAAYGCLIPLEDHISSEFLSDQAANSIGKSHPSYLYDGHQWALAIDAAAQISSYRTDLLVEVPRTWDEVLTLARKLKAGGKHWVAATLCPIDTLMHFFSIAASTGEDPCTTSDVFVSRQVGRYALAVMIELKEICHPESINWNPIMTYNRMSNTDEIAYCPLGFGYTNYGRKGFAPKLLSFANVPRQANSSTARGAIFGGTGFAISSRCQHIPQAVDYAVFTASPHVQRGLYFDHGGQPGHRAAWLDVRTNAACNNFFKDTLETLDKSYLRPRYDGYMWLQETAWYAMHAFLARGGDPETMLNTLDDLYRQSLQRKTA